MKQAPSTRNQGALVQRILRGTASKEDHDRVNAIISKSNKLNPRPKPKIRPVHRESSTRCRLLELPSELRDEIFKLALQKSEDFTIDIDDHYTIPLGVTGTCKQIYKECGDLLYSLNNLRIDQLLTGVRCDDFYKFIAAQAKLGKFNQVVLNLDYIGLMGNQDLDEFFRDVDLIALQLPELLKIGKQVLVSYITDHRAFRVGMVDCEFRITTTQELIEDIKAQNAQASIELNTPVVLNCDEIAARMFSALLPPGCLPK